MPALSTTEPRSASETIHRAGTVSGGSASSVLAASPREARIGFTVLGSAASIKVEELPIPNLGVWNWGWELGLTGQQRPLEGHARAELECPWIAHRRDLVERRHRVGG